MRKTFDEDAPPLPPGGVMPLPMQRQMSCMVCKAGTPVETLNNFGARCGRCFTAYCRGAFAGLEPQVSREEAVKRLASFVGTVQ